MIWPVCSATASGTSASTTKPSRVRRTFAREPSCGLPTAWTTVEKIKGVMYAREAFYDRATAMPGEMPAMMPVVHHGQLAFRKRHQPIWQKNAQRRKLQRRYAAHA